MEFEQVIQLSENDVTFQGCFKVYIGTKWLFLVILLKFHVHEFRATVRSTSNCGYGIMH